MDGQTDGHQVTANTTLRNGFAVGPCILTYSDNITQSDQHEGYYKSQIQCPRALCPPGQNAPLALCPGHNAPSINNNTDKVPP